MDQFQQLTLLLLFVQSERARGVLQAKKHMQREGHLTEDAVRMGFAVEQAENEVAHEEHDVERAFSRLGDFFSNILDQITQDPECPATLKLKVMSFKPIVHIHAMKEIAELKKAIERIGAKIDPETGNAAADTHLKLERIAQMQEDAIESLLKTVSGVKLHALKELLEETFMTVRHAPSVQISDTTMTQIEQIADKLYEESIKLDEGKRQFAALSSQIKGIPREMKRELDNSKDEDAFAENLDALNDLARMTAGKEEVATIENGWRKSVDRIEDKVHMKTSKMLDNGNDPLESSLPEEAMQEELEVDVQAVLAIQRMVAAGKLPTHLVDFTALNLKDDSLEPPIGKSTHSRDPKRHDAPDEERDENDEEKRSSSKNSKSASSSSSNSKAQPMSSKKSSKSKRGDDDDD
jgi:hypothetical protein